MVLAVKNYFCDCLGIMKHDIISSAIFKTKLTQNIIYVKQTNDLV